MEKINAKEMLQRLIDQDGFCNIAGTLGEVAREQETLIRNTNDALLREAFIYTLCALVECHAGAGKRNKNWIERLVKTDFIKYALEVANWESLDHCFSFQKAVAKIKSWNE